jgi:hypothetical protein
MKMMFKNFVPVQNTQIDMDEHDVEIFLYFCFIFGFVVKFSIEMHCLIIFYLSCFLGQFSFQTNMSSLLSALKFSIKISTFSHRTHLTHRQQKNFWVESNNQRKIKSTKHEKVTRHNTNKQRGGQML